MVMAVNTATRLRRLLFIQAASVATISAVAVWKGRVLGGRLEGVLNGNYSNSNDLAVSIVISLPLCLALLFLSKNVIWKAAWALAIVTDGLRNVADRFESRIYIAPQLWSLFVFGNLRFEADRTYLVSVVAAALALVLLVSSGSMVGDRLKETLELRRPSFFNCVQFVPAAAAVVLAQSSS